MADLLTIAFRIAKLMYDEGFVGANTVTVAELKARLDLSDKDFDDADSYLLESHLCDGTMGGNSGLRRLTAAGIQFAGTKKSDPPSPLLEAITPPLAFTEEPEIGHVLFTDIVGFSKLRLTEQQVLHNRLTALVQNLARVVQDKTGNELIALPTGDGIALVFFKGLKRHVEAAIELSERLRTDPSIKLRMGLHSGPVQRVVDINNRPNVTGPGINIAQRIMDCGDAGHILTSREVADVLRELGEFEEVLHDLGIAEVKHGKQIQLFNLCNNGYGNLDTPSKLSTVLENSKASTRSEPVTASPSEDDFIKVLLTASDGRAVITNAEGVDTAETLKLTLIISDPQDRSLLSDLRKKPSNFIGIAYKNIGMHARVKSVSSTLKHGKEIWTVDVQPFEGDYRGGGLGEMACGKYSADQIAEMRARRILLDEKPPDYLTTEDEMTRRLNNAMLETFIQGTGTQVQIKKSIIPTLYTSADGDTPGFLTAARLFSVLWLHVSGVIEHITQLTMEMKGESELAVSFEGRRPRAYANAEPSVIKFDGVCKLTA